MLVDDTCYHDSAAYAEVISEYVSLLSARGGVRSVYQFGSVGVPGLSDIDLIVVLKNRLIPGRLRYLLVDQPAGISRYLFVHHPLFVNQRLFEKLNYMFPLFNLSHVWGEHLSMDKVGERHRYDLAVAHLINMLITKVPVDFYEFLINDKALSARNTIGMLNSFKHTYNLYQAISGDAIEEIENYVRTFEEFRATWFDRSVGTRIRALKTYIHRIASPVSALVGRAGEIVDDRYGLVSECDLEFRTARYNYRFSRGWEATDLNDDIRRGSFPIRLPLGCAILLLHGCVQRSPFGRFLRSGMRACRWELMDGQLNRCFLEFSRLKYEYARFAESALLMSGTPYVTLGYRSRRLHFLSRCARILGS